MKSVLHSIVNDMEEVGTHLEALEAVLIRKGVLTQAEVDSQRPAPKARLTQQLAALRQDIDLLPI